MKPTFIIIHDKNAVEVMGAELLRFITHELLNYLQSNTSVGRNVTELASRLGACSDTCSGQVHPSKTQGSTVSTGRCREMTTQ